MQFEERNANEPCESAPPARASADNHLAVSDSAGSFRSAHFVDSLPPSKTAGPIRELPRACREELRLKKTILRNLARLDVRGVQAVAHPTLPLRSRGVDRAAFHRRLPRRVGDEYLAWRRLDHSVHDAAAQTPRSGPISGAEHDHIDFVL
jgi:hypothetical protein